MLRVGSPINGPFRWLEMLGILGVVDVGVSVFWFGDVGVFGGIGAASDRTVHYGRVVVVLLGGGGGGVGFVFNLGFEDLVFRVMWRCIWFSVYVWLLGNVRKNES